MRKFYLIVFFSLLWGWINNNASAQYFTIEFQDGTEETQDLNLLDNFKFPDNLLQVNYLSGESDSYDLSAVSTVYFLEESITTAVDNMKSENQEVSVFPNPASDVIYLKNISETGIYLCIYEIDGKLIKSEVISDVNQSFDISNLQNGIYIIKINNQAIKFIKK